jgi:hypothetical protein
MADIVQPQMGLNFEQVWAALMETDRLFRESKAETDRQMKELQKSMGYLSNRFGELAEHLVLPSITHKFNALGYHFDDIAKERKFVNPETGRIEAEFDILLENETYSIGVEVKSKPAERDVQDHIRRLEFLRSHKDKRGDQRTIRGAIAGAIMPEAVRLAALRAGLYVIEQSGDTVRIEEPEEIGSW